MAVLSVIVSSMMFGVVRLFKCKHTYYDYVGDYYPVGENRCTCGKK